MTSEGILGKDSRRSEARAKRISRRAVTSREISTILRGRVRRLRGIGSKTRADGVDELAGRPGAEESQAGWLGEVAEHGLEGVEGKGRAGQQPGGKALAGFVELREVEPAAGEALGQVGEFARGEGCWIEDVEKGLAAVVGRVGVGC